MSLLVLSVRKRDGVFYTRLVMWRCLFRSTWHSKHAVLILERRPIKWKLSAKIFRLGPRYYTLCPAAYEHALHLEESREVTRDQAMRSAKLGSRWKEIFRCGHKEGSYWPELSVVSFTIIVEVMWHLFSLWIRVMGWWVLAFKRIP